MSVSAMHALLVPVAELVKLRNIYRAERRPHSLNLGKPELPGRIGPKELVNLDQCTRRPDMRLPYALGFCPGAVWDP
jgi:hypothetical protein